MADYLDEKMTPEEYFEIMLSCVAYTFRQVETSSISVLGTDETREDTLKLLAQVYKEFSRMVRVPTVYWSISTRTIAKALYGEL